MRNRPCIVTIFGAESTGKTTLSQDLAKALPADWKEEFARPYLETTGQAVTTDSMHAIWLGQKALQKQARHSTKPYVIQDTDLFSTVGYWCLPHVESVIGICPKALVRDADTLRSDLYIITQSNIPFEPDILRYGGDKRESPDSFWVAICEQYHLPYVILQTSDRAARTTEAIRLIHERSQSCAVS